MRFLTINRTFIKHAETGQWQIRYQGNQHSKSGMPLLLVIPRELSRAYDYYCSCIRPVIVKNAMSLSDKPSKLHMHREKYVFPHTSNLGPRYPTIMYSLRLKRNENYANELYVYRDDFIQWTKQITCFIIRKPISPHRFRHAVTQLFYDKGASPNEMSVLAELMQV